MTPSPNVLRGRVRDYAKRAPAEADAQVRIYGLNTFSVAARRLSSCSPLAVRRRCLGCRTVKRVERAWLSNAMAMTHHRRIVNARGTQKWHGNDRKDVRHPTLPHFGVSHASSHSITHVRGLFHASTENAVSVAGEAQAIGFCPSAAANRHSTEFMGWVIDSSPGIRPGKLITLRQKARVIKRSR